MTLSLGLAFSVFKRGSHKFLIHVHVAKTQERPHHRRRHRHVAHPPRDPFTQAFKVVFDFLLPAFAIYVETRFLGEVAVRETKEAEAKKRNRKRRRRDI